MDFTAPREKCHPFTVGVRLTRHFTQDLSVQRVHDIKKKLVKLCDDVDPYTLRLSADTTMDVSAFPEVSHGCIVNCLVFSSSFATLEEMKAYKSLESHNYFTSGWVKTLSAKRLQGEKVLLLGDVGCSPRFPCRILFITFRGIPWLVSGACRRHARLELGAEKKRTDTVHLTITQKRSLCARV